VTEPSIHEAHSEADPEAFTIIDRPYLMVGNIDYFVDEAERVYFNRAWHHDLVQHLAYLPRITMVAPRRRLSEAQDPSDLVPLSAEQQAQLHLIPLPPSESRLGALLRLVPTLRTIWSAIGAADIVHSGVAGYPIPMGWLAVPVARLRSKKNLMIVESAPWRSPPVDADPPLRKLRKRAESIVFERMARWCCAQADVSFYTQPGYREEFHGAAPNPGYVTPATWINSEDVLAEPEARRLWDEKLRGPVRFLFAGRLVVEKGVNVLLRAIEKLSDAGVVGRVDVIGEGPLREAVERAAAAATARETSFRLTYLAPVPYGAPFFRLLERYHAVVVPSLSDEQPRIVFDAWARAVPVIASATKGLAPYVKAGETGSLVPPGDVDALVAALTAGATNPTPLRDLGLAALTHVRRYTHRAMHANRSQLLARHLTSG
jgi:glycosyltransferase involved in cell wall biosynthesis